MDARDSSILASFAQQSVMQQEFESNKTNLLELVFNNSIYKSTHFDLGHAPNSTPFVITKEDGTKTPNYDLIPKQLQNEEGLCVSADVYDDWVKEAKEYQDVSIDLKIFTSCLHSKKIYPLHMLFGDIGRLMFRKEPYKGMGVSAGNGGDKFYQIPGPSFLVTNVEIMERMVKKFTFKMIKFNLLEKVLGLPIVFVCSDTKNENVEALCSSGRSTEGGYSMSIFSAQNRSVSLYEMNDRNLVQCRTCDSPPSGTYTGAVIDFVRVSKFNSILSVECSVRYLYKFN